jgi:hypothetical protein
MSFPEPNSDAWLDAELRDVPLPAGLLERLEQIAAISDEELDAALRDVPVPSHLAATLERIGQRQLRFYKLRHLASAAAVLLALGLGYFGLVVSFLANLTPQTPPPQTRLRSELTVKQAPAGESLDPGSMAAEFEQDQRPEGFSYEPKPPIPTLVLPQEPASRPLAKSRQIGFEAIRSLNVLDQVDAAYPSLSVSHSVFDEVPDLKKVPGLKPRGMSFPPLLGYDLTFLSRTGFHPFVCPAVNPQLSTVVTPLGADTESFELARRYLEDGELPPRAELRTEEFLAAIDYHYPRPTNEALGLFMAGGPSPFRVGSFQLLQVGVQAREAPAASRPPVRLTLAVDVSGSMGWGGRLEMVRQALTRLFERMGPQDRISLVTFGASAAPLIEDARLEQRDQLVAALASLQTSGSTNFLAGLRSAYAVALWDPPTADTANRVVLLTDGLTGLEPWMAEQVQARLIQAAARGVSLHVIDLNQERERDAADSMLSLLTQRGGGQIYRAASVDQVRWALDEILTGKSQRVASEARLRLTLNPKAVAFYRLLGHEPRTVAVLKPARLETDFFAGQAATALYEILLIPKGAGNVALAELSWRDPQTGQTRHVSQTIQRGQFAAQLLQAAVPLQAAAVVAEAAETLRGSPFGPSWPNAGSLEPVVQLAHQVDSRLLSEPSYSALVALLEKAADPRPSRGGGAPHPRAVREPGK